MTVDLTDKARAYLAEGRITLVEILFDSAHLRLLFHVRGSDTAPYFVKARREQIEPFDWTCDCPARVDECAHVRACKMVLPDGVVIEKAPQHYEDPDITKLLEG